jgi:hypothetical protein
MLLQTELVNVAKIVGTTDLNCPPRRAAVWDNGWQAGVLMMASSVMSAKSRVLR